MPKVRLWSLIATSLVSMFPHAAWAQANAAPAPAKSPAPSNTAAPSADAATAAGSAMEPQLPRIDDPMLTPPEPAPHILRNWQEALTMLRRDSTSLRSSQARIQQASALARTALAPALPSLTGRAAIEQHLLTGVRTQRFGNEVFSSDAPDPTLTWNAGLDLRVPLLAPQAWYDHGTAKDSVDSARLDTKEVERQQIAIVASAIVGVVTNERLAEVSRVSLGSALSTLDLTKRRATLGAASLVDVLRIEQEASVSRSEVVLRTENLRRARETLGEALGSAEAYGVTPEIRLDALVKDAQNTCTRENSVETRPDVRAAAASVRVAERSVKSVDYAFLPTVDGVSNLTYLSDENDSPNAEHVVWTIGGVLSWNIFDGGFRNGTRAVREADVALSKDRLTETRRRAQLEVTQSMRGVSVAEANLAVSARTREIAQQTARLTRIAYLNGTGTSFDLVDSARRLREAELDFAIKEFEVLRAKITALLALATCQI